ncbi:MAG: TIGR01777 family oxidoreductase [Rubricoccaceae bacterium]|nr:TIGR01777 family oxidoreductase [Rubricoccaceae bacterium]
MNVFITGGTGFIGRALTLRLRQRGHSVTVLTRSPKKARNVLGREAELLSVSSGEAGLSAALERADAVVNLAGESLLGGRWTESKKARLRESRVDLTQELVELMKSTTSRPKVLVSASAVGIYGDRGEREITESEPPTSGFLSELCVDWESAAMEAEKKGVRVVTPRFGVVLGREDGALAQMLPAFRLGLGGPIGPGNQFVPWIHIDDLIELIIEVIADDRYSGPVNATAPIPVTFRTLAKSIGAVLNRPAVLRVPSIALKAIFGQASSVLTQSQRVVPQRASELDFEFTYSTIETALTDLLDTGSIAIERVDIATLPDSQYLEKRPPRYALRTDSVIERPVSEVFGFFSNPENLGLITPPAMKFQIVDSKGAVGEGDEIRYRFKVGPVSFSWTTRIETWRENSRFVDVQARGPYACWWHEHQFEEHGEHTLMRDTVYYSPPAGPLGRLANRLFVADQLKRVFEYRTAVLHRRFND